jgi:hypothetical protein
MIVYIMERKKHPGEPQGFIYRTMYAFFVCLINELKFMFTYMHRMSHHTTFTSLQFPTITMTSHNDVGRHDTEQHEKVKMTGMMVKYTEYICSANLKIAPSTMEPANSAEL